MSESGGLPQIKLVREADGILLITTGLELKLVTSDGDALNEMHTHIDLLHVR